MSFTSIDDEVWDFIEQNHDDYYGSQLVADIDDYDKILRNAGEDVDPILQERCVANYYEFLNEYHQMQLKLLQETILSKSK